MAADAGVVPVGQDHAAVRGHADVAQTEPRIRAGHQQFLFQFVARPLRLDVEGAKLARPGVGVQQLAVVFLRQQRAFVEADAGRAAEAGSQHFMNDARLLLVPVALAGAARVVAVIAAGHHVADARLLAAVVVVVGEPNFAETVDAAFVIVAEVVGDQFQVLAVHVAAPDGAGPAIGAVRLPLAALAVARLQPVHAGVADGEIELAVRPDVDAVNAVVVVEAFEAG